MKKKVNLLDIVSSESEKPGLQVVRLGTDETAIIPFTADGEETTIHYCSETEIQGYVLCNGDDCVLCKIGRKCDQRLLLPVYLPASDCVGVLPVSRSLRPYALLPQIINILKSSTPMVTFITRERAKYTVSTSELPEDVDGGDVAISLFLEEYKAGNMNLSSVYPKFENEQLAGAAEISRIIELKGIKVK